MTLTWESPPEEDLNGVLRQYVIHILENETGRIFTDTSNDERTILLDLHPYYTYSVAVAAETVGTGPFSNSITIQLAEDSKYCTMYTADSTYTAFTHSNLNLHDCILQYHHQHQKIFMAMLWTQLQFISTGAHLCQLFRME